MALEEGSRKLSQQPWGPQNASGEPYQYGRNQGFVGVRLRAVPVGSVVAPEEKALTPEEEEVTFTRDWWGRRRGKLEGESLGEGSRHFIFVDLILISCAEC